jgi:hypothetical protein
MCQTLQTLIHPTTMKRAEIALWQTLDGPRFVVRLATGCRTGRRFLALRQAVRFAEKSIA